MTVRSGLDLLVREGFERLAGKRVGLLVHPPSVDASLRHAVDLFRAAAGFELVRLFGPQHGFRGETQDNMIEWEGFKDPDTGLEVYSLYGEHRKPTPEMLEGLDVLVIDLQDVGTRVYTFNWTTLLAMEACAEAGVKVLLLDRPNPVQPAGFGGPVLDMEYRSFVGMAPVPLAHGMSAGELAFFCNETLEIGCGLEVLWAEGWRRSMWFEDTGLPWVLPSPNLPTVDSAVTYPGFVLMEGTNLSEGRGTTRPFELIGAPYVDPRALARRLEFTGVPGAVMRPTHFQPVFQKWSGKLCGGIQVHVTDRAAFRPVFAAAAVLCAVRELWPERFSWNRPPYEYETEKMPIDILSGSPRLREGVDAGVSPAEMTGLWETETAAFAKAAEGFLHYEP